MIEIESDHYQLYAIAEGTDYKILVTPRGPIVQLWRRDELHELVLLGVGQHPNKNELLLSAASKEVFE